MRTKKVWFAVFAMAVVWILAAQSMRAAVLPANKTDIMFDGEKIHDWQDPAPLDGGYFALRTFCTVLEYNQVLLARVV